MGEGWGGKGKAKGWGGEKAKAKGWGGGNGTRWGADKAKGWDGTKAEASGGEEEAWDVDDSWRAEAAAPEKGKAAWDAASADWSKGAASGAAPWRDADDSHPSSSHGKTPPNGLRSMGAPKGYSRAQALTTKDDETEAMQTPSGGRLGLLARAMEAVGALAGLMTTAAFLPQVIEIERTGDVAGLSLHMYIVFVGGVGMWVLYGVCKKSPSLVAANCVTFVLASYILWMIVTRKETSPPPPPPRVAVCLAGTAHTLAHPRVVAAVASQLALDDVDLFAAVSIERELHSDNASAWLRSPQRVREALESMGVVEYVFYERANWTSSNCSLPSAHRLHLAPAAFGVHSCLPLIQRHEARLNRSYAFLVRARPDALWRAPLPSAATWPRGQVLAPLGAIDELAVVPRPLAASYFGAYELLQHGCWLLRSGLRSRLVTHSSHCVKEGVEPACLFQLKLMVDGVSVTHLTCDGLPLLPPPLALLCNASNASLPRRNMSSHYVCV
ncbi:hypothetical protein AB1Y20_010300 [Prymnesium parvum]|uniref:Uncharacterized protein n=1 Tax=Prymnesium parvum TaxID=97485 RepID=A0AB34K4X4_PRYPA